MRSILLFCFIFNLLTLPTARGQEPKNAPPKPINKWGKAPPSSSSFSVGVGTLIGHNHRVDSQTWPYNARTYLRVIPLAELKYGRLSIFGPFASLNLFQSQDWGLSLRAGIQGDQYRGTDMEERDWSFFGGATLKYKWISFTYARDVQSVSNGTTYGIESGPKFPLSRKIFVMLSAGVTYLDKNYANYYYGVRPEESTVIRPAYEIDDAFIYSLSLRPLFMLTDKWTFMTMVKISFYSPEVSHSPTVREEPGVSGLVGLTYKLF